ncbi:MAG: DUF2911 domain-containing protein [Longimicrobiales bacterium]|nr:DUF2911 domain-containing protein [Longimicrobiales bacterium]
MRSVRSLPLAALATLTLAAPIQAQDIAGCFVRGGDPQVALQRPSPLGAVSFTVGGEAAKLCYGRPKANGRKIMGELVPFGAPWRLGANEATALHLRVAADIGGVKVEPGVYSLYAVPGETEWEFFVNRQWERHGIPINDAVKAGDVGSFKRPVAATAGMVEQLTFTWMSEGADMGHLVLEWENTKVEIPVHKGGM